MFTKKALNEKSVVLVRSLLATTLFFLVGSSSLYANSDKLGYALQKSDFDKLLQVYGKNKPLGITLKCPKNFHNFFSFSGFPEYIRKQPKFQSTYGTNDVRRVCRHYKEYFSNGIDPRTVASSVIAPLEKLKEDATAVSKLENGEMIPDYLSEIIESFNSKYPYYRIHNDTSNKTTALGFIDFQIRKAKEIVGSKCPSDISGNEDWSSLTVLYGRFFRIHNYGSCNGEGYLASNSKNWSMDMNNTLIYCTISEGFGEGLTQSNFFLSEINSGKELPDLDNLDVGMDGQIIRDGVTLSGEDLEIGLKPGSISSLEVCVLKQYCDFIPTWKGGAPYIIDCGKRIRAKL